MKKATSDLEKAWRRRLAQKLRIFRKVRGHFPSRDIVQAMKRGVSRAVEMNLRLPIEH